MTEYPQGKQKTTATFAVWNQSLSAQARDLQTSHDPLPYEEVACKNLHSWGGNRKQTASPTHDLEPAAHWLSTGLALVLQYP